MNISFTPANYRPNFQASFDPNSHLAIRGYAQEEPESLIAAALVLKDVPDEDVFKVRCEYTGGYYPDYHIYKNDSRNPLDFGEHDQCYRDLFRAFCDHYEKRIGDFFETYFGDKYTSAAEAIFEGYKKRFYSEESLKLEKEIELLRKQKEDIKITLQEKEARKAKLDEVPREEMIDAIANDVLYGKI